ncbi:uncharacterized protein LOC131855449 [Achroia grisella]|uniref:uncharacterized protein LOC131855449 n=1 Tax=Achroia grisella TaxID=688607 RepID=UPI0027D1F1CB|nr:uncharacterized protein LOC131855449 [Achroia grisella]
MSMYLKGVALLTICLVGECVYVYSSFWAPLFDPRILNYRVDSPFDPDSGKNARTQYTSKYGVRGENLIADLGNGKGFSGYSDNDNKEYNNVKFYYTYPGADHNEEYSY